MSTEKELAYRYDLFISPDWKQRFDQLLDEKLKLPAEGRFLEVNCGTGKYATELAERIGARGKVNGLDPSEARIELARAKALVLKLSNVTFDTTEPEISFPDDYFDYVIGDASMVSTGEIPALLSELVRVARPGGRVALKLVTRGSFDEFFSFYWEALLATDLTDHVWQGLEAIIDGRLTVSDAEEMTKKAGLGRVDSFTSREEVVFEDAVRFLESPLIQDYFLPLWLAIIPPGRREEVVKHISAIIERERHEDPFDVSIKATVVTGLKDH
jgi:ubiquinone/menaquinone biosynthesis C-methylase UbiE